MAQIESKGPPRLDQDEQARVEYEEQKRPLVSKDQAANERPYDYQQK